MKKVICILITALAVNILVPSFFATTQVEAEASEIRSNLEFENSFDQYLETPVNDVSNDMSDPELAVPPLVIWGAGVIGGWLGAKLLDWGAVKFCKAYRNTNAVTKSVCSVIAP
ncbi:histidine kinase [Enterococcus faecalis]|uniref:histidine kinase n=1 Tax=Enterococcus faecalis TaxID=1351 RepID=UPI002DBCFB07|nr:histidine kinase [Enterococcus faecalis]MEB7792115.1 histidine kinase [Enterococcus faecalis]MEB7810098.1 histidine kinase [Enterococcus faecalis]